ncbi:MAG: hypothetical protein EPO00_04220, partial [Chloroflexota bacterium]
MARVGFVLAIIGGAFWMSLPFYPPECVPVTGDSEVFCNRLWSPAFAAMLIGAIALYGFLRRDGSGRVIPGFRPMIIGFALMTAGNVGEYWLAFHLPHQGGLGGIVRGLLWMAVLAGWLTALVGSFIAGAELLRSKRRDRHIGWLFLLGFPLTFVLAITVGPNLAPLPIGLLGVVVGIYGLT